MSAYTDAGYADRGHYLIGLSEEYDVPIRFVVDLSEILGPEEDFDQLVQACEAYANMENGEDESEDMEDSQNEEEMD
jgi:hypothetical protein